MSATLPVSVLLAVRNEEKNIRKCLASLQPAAEVVVVDSQSSDGTASIAAGESAARVVQFHYTGAYPKKRQWALDNLEFKGEWILLLDADEQVPPALWEEIQRCVRDGNACDAYLIRKGFHFLGRKFRFGGFSHSAVLLLRKGAGRFEELAVSDCGMDMEVHERVLVDGKIGALKTPLIHEDFKGLQAYLERHNQYSTWEAHVRAAWAGYGKPGAAPIRSSLLGNAQERRRWLKRLVRRLPFEPLIWFVYHYFFRLGFLEGRPGLIACRIRAAYIFQVRAKMYELQLKARR